MKRLTSIKGLFPAALAILALTLIALGGARAQRPALASTIGQAPAPPPAQSQTSNPPAQGQEPAQAPSAEQTAKPAPAQAAPAGPAQKTRPPAAPAFAPIEIDPKPFVTKEGVRIEKTWIPMSDGVKLAVTLYSPGDAKPTDKFPAILEYIPYRKDDWQEQWDYELHSYFVLHGYVSARVDIRGTGTSEGAPPDREYSEQEQKDGMEVIAWLASQTWSSGSVGMMGISWGGFNALQLASRRPPALKTIIAAHATEQLFHDDVHYIDGILHADEYELGMDQELMMTSTPDFPMDDAHLAPRFDSTPWFLTYLKHQRDGEYWRQPFAQPVYESIQIPVFLIGGYYDGYRDTIPRMLEKMKTPVKALLGPWNHTYPNGAEPGPEFEWREMAVRWWDRWLKGTQNGIENEPKLAVYQRHWYPPGMELNEIPGEWRSENSWPPAGMKEQTFYLGVNHQLNDAAPKNSTDKLRYIPSNGVQAGLWWGELTNDQRPSDAYSLVYDSAPLENETAILGFPHVELNVSSTAPLADWMARLSDVAPDGTTTLITGAAKSGAQRVSADSPQELDPKVTYRLGFDLHVTSWTFPRGHRIRLAISNALWPMLWPTPYAMTTMLELGGENASRLVLPIVPLSSATVPHFPTSVPDPSLPGFTHTGSAWPGTFEITRDEKNRTARVHWHGTASAKFPWGVEEYSEELYYSASDEHPELSSVHGVAYTKITLQGRAILFQSVVDVASDAKVLKYQYQRVARENGKVVRQKVWREQVPRDLQ
jgi:putative CocE/NonD family hydrolase